MIDRQAVIQETLRLVPVNTVPLERIVPDGGLVVGDTYLEPGMRVGVSAGAIHHMVDVYGEDHELYRPERWLDEGSDRIARMRKCFLAVCIASCTVNMIYYAGFTY